MKNLVLSIVALVTVDAAAGTKVGNGGDVVVCEDGRIELLDYYEGRILRGLQVDHGSETESVTERVRHVLDRLEGVDYWRAQDYKKWFANFFHEVLFVNDSLVDIPDSEHIIIPYGCSLRQLVIQQKPRFPEDKRYIIDKKLWSKLSSKDKAGAVLHELIYRESIERLSHENSVSVRYLNAFVSSGKIVGIDFLKYRRLIKELDFGTLSLEQVEMDVDAKVGFFGAPREVHSLKQVHYIENHRYFRAQLPKFEFVYYKNLQFSPDGELQTYIFASEWEPTFPFVDIAFFQRTDF